MTTNTYQALCDSVGAYYMQEGREYDSEGNICSWYKNYPEQSAEQRERLLLLFFKKARVITLFKCGEEYNFQSENYTVGKAYGNDTISCSTDFNNSIYSHCQKLCDKGVLSKEEVQKALKGGE